MEAGRLLGDQHYRGTKAKSITSCDNAFVTNIMLAQAAHRTPLGSSALRESEASVANVLSVAKAKQQLQSAQPERKSTTRFGDDPKN